LQFNIWKLPIMNLIINGLLLGLSTGIFCLSYCLPVIVPLILAQERQAGQAWWLVGRFAAGRLFGYLVFGALVGYLGLKIQSSLIHRLVWWAVIILAVFLILYALGLLKPKSFFCQHFKKIGNPLLFGFLVGLNICPPFLVALSYGFNLASVWQGMILFLSFFVGTTLFLLPAGFLGVLSRRDFLRRVGQVAALLSGVIYLIYGLWNLLRIYG